MLLFNNRILWTWPCAGLFLLVNSLSSCDLKGQEQTQLSLEVWWYMCIQLDMEYKQITDPSNAINTLLISLCPLQIDNFSEFHIKVQKIILMNYYAWKSCKQCIKNSRKWYRTISLMFEEKCVFQRWGQYSCFAW